MGELVVEEAVADAAIAAAALEAEEEEEEEEEGEEWDFASLIQSLAEVQERQLRRDGQRYPPNV